METDYSAIYPNLFFNHWWWRSRNKIVFSKVQSLQPAPRRILDIGCGNGLFFERLGQIGEVWGIEPSSDFPDVTESIKQKIHFGSIETAPYEKNSFDLIVLLDVVEHVPDDTSFLQLARNFLKPDGRILITVPALKCLWTAHDDINHHVIRYSKPELSNLLERSGYASEELRYLFFWPALCKFIQHQMYSPSTTVEEALPQIPPAPVNKLCEFLCDLERPLFSCIPQPFGSSLIAVAKPRG